MNKLKLILLILAILLASFIYVSCVRTMRQLRSHIEYIDDGATVKYENL